jgi:hypothetical protein
VTPAVELHLDVLVLRGVARSDATRVAVAVERELARFLEDRGVRAGTGPAALGAEVASVIERRVSP